MLPFTPSLIRGHSLVAFQRKSPACEQRYAKASSRDPSDATVPVPCSARRLGSDREPKVGDAGAATGEAWLRARRRPRDVAMSGHLS